MLLVAWCALLLLQQGHGAAEAGGYLSHAPIHVPRIGRRGDGEQSSIVGGFSKNLYYQLPRNYPRVGRADPSLAEYPVGRSDEDLLSLWRSAAVLDHPGEEEWAGGPIPMEGKEPFMDPEVGGETDRLVAPAPLFSNGAHYDDAFFKTLQNSPVTATRTTGHRPVEGAKERWFGLDGADGKGWDWGPGANKHGTRPGSSGSVPEWLFRALFNRIFGKRINEAPALDRYRQEEADLTKKTLAHQQLWKR